MEPDPNKCTNPDCKCENCNCGPNCVCGKDGNPPTCGCDKEPGACWKKSCCPSKMGKPCFPKARIGEPAPYFEAQAYYDGDFKTIKLSDFKDKWVVLFFYPMDFTFVCPTELCAFSDASDNFAKINTCVVGCSSDSKYVHREFALRDRKQGGVAPLKIPLLADNSHCICKMYDCMILKGEDKGCAYRATYIIDPNGILRHISINDTQVGRSVDEVMRLVTAFQFADEHGEVCPANWKQGRKTMKPKAGDPDLKKYFEDELGKGK